MQILMTNWVYPPEFSGAAIQCHRLSKALRTLGVNVRVLTGTHESGLVGQDSVDGIPVFRILRDRSSVMGQAKYWWEIEKYFRKHRKIFDIVHTHGFHPRINMAAKRTGLPVLQKITAHHLDDPLAVRHRPLGKFKYKIYDKADAVIPTSKLLEEACQASPLPQNRIIRIPNGVDIDVFHPVPKQEKLRLCEKFHTPKEKVVLLAVGSVSYRKGLDMLVHAIYELDDKLKDRIRLWIVGPTHNQNNYGKSDPTFNEFTDSIRSLIGQLSLEHVVQFKGRQNNIQEYMQAADVFVHPSRNEGQPNSILEAMACGLPAVANMLPGITDEIIQTGRFGYLVNCEETQTFAAALRVLIKNASLRERLGQQARTHILRHYDINKIAQRYISVYSGIFHKDAFEKVKSRSPIWKQMLSWKQ